MKKILASIAIFLLFSLTIVGAVPAANPNYPYPPPLPPTPQLPSIPSSPSNPANPPTSGQPITPANPTTPAHPANPAVESADSLYREGIAAAARGDTTTAIARFQTLLNRFPNDSRAAEASFRAGDCARQASDYNTAMGFYRRVVSYYSNSTRCEEAFYYVGFCQVMANDLLGALNQYIAFINRYPNGPLTDDAWLVLGHTYEKLNDPGDAATCYRELMSRFPSSEFYSQASERLHQIDSGYVPNQPPTSSPGQQNLSDRDLYDCGHTHLSRGNFNAARTYFDELLRRYPTSGWADDAMLWKGKSYIEERNWKAAADVFNQFKFRYQKSELLSDAHYDFAWCLYQQGLASAGNHTVLQQAASEFASFAYRYSTHSQAPEALYMAGECYDRDGNAQTARRYFQETITRYPNSSSAQKAQERLNGLY